MGEKIADRKGKRQQMRCELRGEFTRKYVLNGKNVNFYQLFTYNQMQLCFWKAVV